MGCWCLSNNNNNNDGGGGVGGSNSIRQSNNGGGKQNSNTNSAVVPYCQRSWRVWRYCCCRYGYYPLIVAPVVTAACLLSLYSSTGCEYVNLQIGFVPANTYYNNQSSVDSEAMLGLFFYTDPENTEEEEHVHDNDLRERFHDNCVSYPAQFESDFITNDRTWKVARVMAMIAAVSSVVCAVVGWLIVMAPMPVNIVWPGIMLPLIMLSFIAEGSKFLIFDIALCSNALWLPSGVDSIPQPAESCSLGQSAIYGIAAAALFLVGLLLICLHTPDQRMLDPDYGIVYMGTAAGAGGALAVTNDMEEPTNRVDDDDDDVIDGLHYTGSNDRDILDDSGDCIGVDDYRRGNSSDINDGESEFSVGDVYTTSGMTTTTTMAAENASQQDEQPSHESSLTTNTTGDNSTSLLTNKDDVDSKPNDVVIGSSNREQISESRISKMEELEMNAVSGANSLLHDLVSDLDTQLGAAVATLTSSKTTTTKPDTNNNTGSGSGSGGTADAMDKLL